jgi:peptidoglycan/xylan/chitin deacetylase (PgdA/CDA1 family)
VVEHGGFLYDADYYGDDLPFWTKVKTAHGDARWHLVIPYTLDANDMRFAALRRFLDHIEKFDRVWVCRRVDIARHWRKNHPIKQE